MQKAWKTAKISRIKFLTEVITYSKALQKEGDYITVQTPGVLIPASAEKNFKFDEKRRQVQWKVSIFKKSTKFIRFFSNDVPRQKKSRRRRKRQKNIMLFVYVCNLQFYVISYIFAAVWTFLLKSKLRCTALNDIHIPRLPLTRVNESISTFLRQ